MKLECKTKEPASQTSLVQLLRSAFTVVARYVTDVRAFQAWESHQRRRGASVESESAIPVIPRRLDSPLEGSGCLSLPPRPQEELFLWATSYKEIIPPFGAKVNSWMGVLKTIFKLF